LAHQKPLRGPPPEVAFGLRIFWPQTGGPSPNYAGWPTKVYHSVGQAIGRFVAHQTQKMILLGPPFLIFWPTSFFAFGGPRPVGQQMALPPTQSAPQLVPFSSPHHTFAPKIDRLLGGPRTVRSWPTGFPKVTRFGDAGEGQGPTARRVAHTNVQRPPLPLVSPSGRARARVRARQWLRGGKRKAAEHMGPACCCRPMMRMPGWPMGPRASSGGQWGRAGGVVDATAPTVVSAWLDICERAAAVSGS
jgi:hypothetical protein